MRERDKEILNAAFPQELAEESDYLLRLGVMSQESPELLERMANLEDASQHPKVQEAKRVLRQAIEASSGAMKVIEQVIGPMANVPVPDDEKGVRDAMRRLFGGVKSQITFEDYKQLVEKIRALSQQLHDVTIQKHAMQGQPINPDSD